MEKEKSISFFRFEDLRIYTKALHYAEWVVTKTKDFPNEGERIANSFTNASKSIAINIAEGSARNKSQFIYYLKMAKSSIRECVVLSSLVKSLGLFNAQDLDVSRSQLMEMTKMLGALIGSLQRSNHDNPDHSSDRDVDFENDDFDVD